MTVGPRPKYHTPIHKGCRCEDGWCCVDDLCVQGAACYSFRTWVLISLAIIFGIAILVALVCWRYGWKLRCLSERKHNSMVRCFSYFRDCFQSLWKFLLEKIELCRIKLKRSQQPMQHCVDADEGEEMHSNSNSNSSSSSDEP
eukprot:PhF_6_TR37329/c0_g1_i1/m.54976